MKGGGYSKEKVDTQETLVWEDEEQWNRLCHKFSFHLAS
jgi:hypothetical protein